MGCAIKIFIRYKMPICNFNVLLQIYTLQYKTNYWFFFIYISAMYLMNFSSGVQSITCGKSYGRVLVTGYMEEGDEALLVIFE